MINLRKERVAGARDAVDDGKHANVNERGTECHRCQFVIANVSAEEQTHHGEQNLAHIAQNLENFLFC